MRGSSCIQRGGVGDRSGGGGLQGDRARGGGVGVGRRRGRVGGRSSGEGRVAWRASGAEQIVGARAVNGSRRHVGLGRIAGRRLQHLVGDRLGAGDQALQRGDAGVGGLQDLHAIADAIEQVVDVAGAVVEALRGEKFGRVVERRVDLVAGGEVILGGRKQRRGRLQGEEILAN